MSDRAGDSDDLSIQESPDRIRITALGVNLLYSIAFTAFFACGLALVLNHFINRGPGSYGAVAGMLASLVLFYCLQKRLYRAAIAIILWGFSLIPIFFGLRTFGLVLPVCCLYRSRLWRQVGRCRYGMRSPWPSPCFSLVQFILCSSQAVKS